MYLCTVVVLFLAVLFPILFLTDVFVTFDYLDTKYIVLCNNSLWIKPACAHVLYFFSDHNQIYFPFFTLRITICFSQVFWLSMSVDLLFPARISKTLFHHNQGYVMAVLYVWSKSCIMIQLSTCFHELDPFLPNTILTIQWMVCTLAWEVFLFGVCWC